MQTIVVVAVLLFNVHGKQLRLCQNGQLNGRRRVSNQGALTLESDALPCAMGPRPCASKQDRKRSESSD